MKNLTAVIGANYGDEGKGLMTDYFAAKDSTKSLVVRFNGGAQAGHTVTLSGGRDRHVFHHFGSGTYAGAATYLSSHFVVNPILFNKEYKELENVFPNVFVNLDSPVTTPYDMLINQWLEQSRGNNRHGSCGVGIHETMIRNLICPLEVSTLFDPDNLQKYIKFIRETYVPNRLKELNISETPEIQRILFSEEFAGKFIDECRKFRFIVQPRTTESIFEEYENIIFEGAQGLLLDQDFGRFPYVTHSNTGLKNIVELIRDSAIDLTDADNEFNICYVTRWYLTRHGAGPLPNERMARPNSKIIDKTNLPNEWQGTLRYGILDINDLHARIEFDRLKYLPTIWWHQIQLAITCLDQTDGRSEFYCDGALMNYPISGFIKTIYEDFSIDKMYASYGPTRNDVREMKETGESI